MGSIVESVVSNCTTACSGVRERSVPEKYPSSLSMPGFGGVQVQAQSEGIGGRRKQASTNTS